MIKTELSTISRLNTKNWWTVSKKYSPRKQLVRTWTSKCLDGCLKHWHWSHYLTCFLKTKSLSIVPDLFHIFYIFINFNHFLFNKIDTHKIIIIIDQVNKILSNNGQRTDRLILKRQSNQQSINKHTKQSIQFPISSWPSSAAAAAIQ